jgi:O-glycosyl hydrolase
MKIFIFKYFVLLSIFFGCSIFSNGQSISINATDYKQTIDMMGGDMERSANAIQSSQNKDEMVDWAYKDIAFNTCRVQFDKNQELVEGTKNWDFYTKQIASMKMVKERNQDIKFFATLRTDYDGYGNDSNLPDWFCDYEAKTVDATKYGVFLADYVEYMSNQGLPIAYLSTMKEWATFVPAAVAKATIEKLNSELEAREIAIPLIIDQGYWSLSKGISELNKIKELGTKDHYYAFCSHNYKNEDSTKWQGFIDAATDLGKAAYNDETGGGYGGPTYGVEPEITSPLAAYVEKCVTYKSGLKGEIFFEIWSRGINKETRAIYCKWGGSGERMRGYYIMKYFANNVVDSKYITSALSAMTDVHTMSFRKDNKIVLWVINSSTSSYSSLPIAIKNETIDGSISQISWTALTPVEGVSGELVSQEDNFTTNIEPQSLNCFIIETSTPTGVNEIEEYKSFLYPTLVDNGIVTLKYSNLPDRIIAYDISGKMVMNSTDVSSKIDVSQLNSGMYFVHLLYEGERQVQKIIIN